MRIQCAGKLPFGGAGHGDAVVVLVPVDLQRAAGHVDRPLASRAPGAGGRTSRGAGGAPTGLGSVLSTITLQFTGQNSPQTIDIDLGQDGQLTGLTQFGSQTNAYISSQDGYGDGELSNLSVDMDGTIKGFYTNGQQRDLGTIGIATFSNEEGLFEEGDGLFSESANSGTAMVGAGAQLGAGLVIGGALENSNVDTAEQFVRLIEAQRGFQANARVITTQDEVLNEVVNLI